MATQPYMSWPDLDRWQRLWQSVGASGDAAIWYDRLSKAYAEPHRHYHNQRHIAECLAEFDRARHLARAPDAVELALWFHDVVYDPKTTDNEERSASFAKDCLRAACLAQLTVTVPELVLVTKLHDVGARSDGALMMDVDLSILGQGESRFMEYEAQVRQEYAWVPKLIFDQKRKEILRRFLDRPRIYATEFFVLKYEENARRNLEGSIERMGLW